MFEVSNTYHLFGSVAGTHSTSTTFNSTSSGIFGHGTSSGYSIGQYRIIDSDFQQPKLAEIAQLYEMAIGADDVYGQERSGRQIMRVSGDDHMPDPYIKNPVGDVPWLVMMILVIGYAWMRKRSIL